MPSVRLELAHVRAPQGSPTDSGSSARYPQRSGCGSSRGDRSREYIQRIRLPAAQLVLVALHERFQPAQRLIPPRGDLAEVSLRLAEPLGLEAPQVFPAAALVAYEAGIRERVQMLRNRLA